MCTVIAAEVAAGGVRPPAKRKQHAPPPVQKGTVTGGWKRLQSCFEVDQSSAVAHPRKNQKGVDEDTHTTTGRVTDEHDTSNRRTPHSVGKRHRGGGGTDLLQGGHSNWNGGHYRPHGGPCARNNSGARMWRLGSRSRGGAQTMDWGGLTGGADTGCDEGRQVLREDSTTVSGARQKQGWTGAVSSRGGGTPQGAMLHENVVTGSLIEGLLLLLLLLQQQQLLE